MNEERGKITADCAGGAEAKAEAKKAEGKLGEEEVVGVEEAVES